MCQQKNIKKEYYDVIGAAMEVHNELKPGLQEAIYQEALAYEFIDRNIPFNREMHLPVQYKNRTLSKHYQVDFVCYDNIIVELKSTESICAEHRNQVFTYLRLMKKQYGLLINFGEKSLHVERYIYDSSTNKCRIISGEELNSNVIA